MKLVRWTILLVVLVGLVVAYRVWEKNKTNSVPMTEEVVAVAETNAPITETTSPPLQPTSKTNGEVEIKSGINDPAQVERNKMLSEMGFDTNRGHKVTIQYQKNGHTNRVAQ